MSGLLLIPIIGFASGFQRSLVMPPVEHRHNVHPNRKFSLHAIVTNEDNKTTDPIAGISAFEEWFSEMPGAQLNNVRHAVFHSNSLRGLEFTSTKSSDLKKVAVIPRKIVLRVPFSDDRGMDSNAKSWDTDLSCKLWGECQKGKNSPYYGYCSLLTHGANLQESSESYPSTAPDALRHWTRTQRKWLKQSEKGKKLLEVDLQQQKEWRQKYDSLGLVERDGMSFENFSWAMEAVHSRAFRGDFGALDAGEGGPLRKLASLLLPASALAFGYFYATDPTMNDYFIPVGIVAAAPVVLTAIADQKGSKEAVMLPLIDSANHLQEADSVIEYDPAMDGFVLSLGRKCLVKEVDELGERAQVCISYGVRKDSELLLNYGFLRGVTMTGIEMGRDRNEIRERLAEAFISRNP